MEGHHHIGSWVMLSSKATTQSMTTRITQTLRLELYPIPPQISHLFNQEVPLSSLSRILNGKDHGFMSITGSGSLRIGLITGSLITIGGMIGRDGFGLSSLDPLLSKND